MCVCVFECVCLLECLCVRVRVCVCVCVCVWFNSSHLFPACAVPLLSLFTHDALVQAGPQHGHGRVTVLQLGARLLAFHHRACRKKL